MENFICKSRTHVTKQMHREFYWGAWRWHGKEKTKFFVNILVEIFELAVLYFLAEFLHQVLSEKLEAWYYYVCAVFWICLVLAIVRTVFQGEFFVLRNLRYRKKMKGDAPVFTEMEFYRDHFRFTSELYDRTEQVPYANIIKYKETSHYCVLFLKNGIQYVYGKEEFLQGTAAEAYALFSKYIAKGK